MPEATHLWPPAGLAPAAGTRHTAPPRIHGLQGHSVNACYLAKHKKRT